MFAASKTAGAAGGAPTDPYFYDVPLLLNGDSVGGTVNTYLSDASTNNFQLTPNGLPGNSGINPFQAGYYSNYFDGSGAYISAPSNSAFNLGTGEFTIECWIYITAFPWYETIIGRQSYNNVNGWGIWIDNGLSNKLSFWCNGYLNKIAGNTPPLNTWQHIAVVRDSSNVITLYQDGVATGSSSIPSFTDATTNLNIGGNDSSNWNGTYPVNGYISNVRIVKGTAVYTSAFTPPTAPLTAISGTSLLTCQSNQFIDNSTNAFTLTLAGTISVSQNQPFTYTAPVTYGSGYFNGSSSLSVSSSNTVVPTGTQDFSVECYVYWGTQSQSYPQIIANPTTNGFQIYYDVGSGQLDVGIFNVANVLTYSIAQSALANTWQHIAVTRSGNTFRLFVNGVLQANGTNTISYASPTTQYIGSDGSRPFVGYLSNVRTVLGSIPTAYQTSSTTNGTSVFTPPSSPLTAVSGTSLLTVQNNVPAQNNTFLDSSNNNFPITRNGNTTQGSFSPYGNLWSNYGAGSGNYLTIPNNAAFQFGSGAFTIECWFFALSASSNQALVAKWADGQPDSDAAWGVDITSGNIRALLASGGSVSVWTGPAVTTNTWNHVAFVRDSLNTVSLFLNGSRVATQSYSSSVNNGTYDAYVFSAFGNNRVFGGYISNARVVKGTAVYDPTQTTYTVPTTPLTAVSGTSLLTCQSNRFIDNSSNAFTLTVNGSPSVQRFSPFNPTAPYDTATIGGSGYFGASTDYLSLSAQTALNVSGGNWTIEFWYYRNAAAGTTVILENNSNGVNGYSIQTDGSNNLVMYVNSNIITSSSPMNLYAWNHCALVRNGSTTTMYLNGVSVGTSSTDAGSTNGGLWIGARSGGSFGISGYMTDLRIVKGTAVYTTTFTPPSAPLTSITNTSFLENYTNAGIPDLAMQNDLQTVGSAQVSTSVKKYGTGSLYFNGTNSALLTPSSPLVSSWTGNFTIEGWVYANLSQFFVFWCNSVANSDGFTGAYIYTDGSVGIGRFAVNEFTTAPGAVTSNTWTHIAFVGYNGTVYIYVNGVSSASGSQSTYMTTATKPITLGRNYQNTPNYSLGYIDDFRVTYGYARYTSNFTPPTAALPTY